MILIIVLRFCFDRRIFLLPIRTLLYRRQIARNVIFYSVYGITYLYLQMKIIHHSYMLEFVCHLIILYVLCRPGNVLTLATIIYMWTQVPYIYSYCLSWRILFSHVSKLTILFLLYMNKVCIHYTYGIVLFCFVFMYIPEEQKNWLCNSDGVVCLSGTTMCCIILISGYIFIYIY